MLSTTPWSGPINCPVLAKCASSAAATSSASGIFGSSSKRSVTLRALRSSNPHALRDAGRRLRVISALMLPACGIGVTGPRIPSGSLTHVPLKALMRARYMPTSSVAVSCLALMALWMSAMVVSTTSNFLRRLRQAIAP